MTIEERLEKLELELAAAKRLTHGLMAGAGFVLGMFILFVFVRVITGVAHGQVEFKEIRANQFILEDAQGQTRGGLSIASNNNVCLFMNDKNGNNSAMLACTDAGPMLSLFDKNRVDIGHIVLGVTNDGLATLSLLDNNGAVIWQAP